MGDYIVDVFILFVKQDCCISLKKFIIIFNIFLCVWGDDCFFEEEIGDLRDIYFGYVVVWKKDLE